MFNLYDQKSDIEIFEAVDKAYPLEEYASSTEGTELINIEISHKSVKLSESAWGTFSKNILSQ